MNWGYKIAIVYTAFAAFMIGLVALCLKQDIHLVTDTYYEESLAYDDHQLALYNAQQVADEVLVTVDKDNELLAVNLPTAHKQTATDAQVQLYYAPDADEDRSPAFDNGTAVIKTTDMARGKWTAKISWKLEDKDFYIEKRFNL